MIREDKIKEITYNKVIKPIEDELIKFGFKYLKSKKYFILKKNGFDQIISIHAPYSPITYDENTDRIFLHFIISSKIEIPEYENWHLEKFGKKPHLSYNLDSIKSMIELSFEDFDNNSFYTPTASQQFKRSITNSLINNNDEKENIIPFDEILKNNIPNLVLELESSSNILHIYNNRKYPFQYMYLLLYGGYQEMAHEILKECYEYLLNEIKTKINISKAEANGYIVKLDEFIQESLKVTTFKFENPFKRTITICQNQNDIFDFSQKTKFVESLRLNISQYEIRFFDINSKGDILILTNDRIVMKFNSKGEIIFEYQLETKNGFDKLYLHNHIPFGIIKGTNNFYVNNYIIKDDNTILELPIPVQKLKKGKFQNSRIIDLAFCENLNKFHILYEDIFITYNSEGQVENSITIGEKSRGRVITRIVKIIIEKKWIIAQKIDESIFILDFNGNIIQSYEVGNGNNLFEFSPNFENLICFFYSTKSQFYNLKDEKKGILWAHPTYIKGYKELMYNDINHNFGLTISKFSPNNKYIVGGADHGKYVAWTLPKLERIELIPTDEIIELLEPHKSTRFLENNKREEIIIKAEKIILDKQLFLKNRGNDISKIIFLENGDIFVTEIGPGKLVLSWNSFFSNLTYKKIKGNIELHSEKYLSMKTDEELVIYSLK